jgi:mono/diheme cytochrome c family protein
MLLDDDRNAAAGSNVPSVCTPLGSDMRLLLGLLLCIFVAAAWVTTRPIAPFRAEELSEAGDLVRGQQVFAAGDCASCHARPGQSDRLLLGGGLALGTFRVPNISPDPVDGIGRWQTADLANALIAGVSPKGKHYYPVFPYTSFTGMTLSDIADLMAYLRTLPPAAGKAPDHELALPFRIRRFIGFWKLLFFREGSTRPHPSGDPVLDRGAYLVEAVAHCAECHSSRNLFAAIKPKTRFAGGVDPENVGFIPNITPAGIGDWSEAQVAEMLRTGMTPDQGPVGSSMADVTTNTALLTEGDRAAIARYVKQLPVRPTARP